MTGVTVIVMVVLLLVLCVAIDARNGAERERRQIERRLEALRIRVYDADRKSVV